MKDFLQRQPWLLQILLLSLAFFVTTLFLLMGQLIIESRADELFTNPDPLVYACIGSVTFGIALLFLYRQREKKALFFIVFYLVWISLLYFSFLFYTYGSSWSEHTLSYSIVFILILFAGTPHNIIFFGLSFLLLQGVIKK